MYNVGCFLLQLLMLAFGLAVAYCLGEAALVCFLFMQVILANLLVLKLVMLFGLEVTACDAYAISALIAVNLLRQFYGVRAVSRAVATSLVFTFLAAGAFVIHNSWIPSGHDTMHAHYAAVLNPVVGVFVISLIVSALVLALDGGLFHAFLLFFPEVSLLRRMFWSILISQAVDTFLFTLWALGPWVVNFWTLFFWSYLVKVVTISLLVPMVLWGIECMRQLSTGGERGDYVRI